MTDAIGLFFVLLGLFASDSLVILRDGDAAFLRHVVRFRAWFVSGRAGRFNVTTLVLNVLPPLGQAFVVPHRPFRLGSEVLIAGEGLPVSWCEFAGLKAGTGDYTLGGKTLKGVTNQALVERTLQLLKRGLSPAEISVRLVTRAFNKRHAECRLQVVRKRISSLRATTNIFWGVCFLYLPSLVFLFGFTPIWQYLALVFWAFAALIAIEFYRIHARLYRIRRKERIQAAVRMALCPILALRACDYLTLPALDAFHPVVVGTLLLKPDPLADLAGQLAVEIEHPVNSWLERTGEGSDFAADADAQRQAFLSYCDREKILPARPAAPVNHGAAEGYCPRCQSQYSSMTAYCTDCQGVPLVRF